MSQSQSKIEFSTLDVVVVDDHRDSRRLIGTILAAFGIAQIRQCESPANALHAIRLKTPDLIVTDWDMKPTNGHEFVKAIRALAGGARIPIVMVTGHAEASVVKAALEAGVNQFLVKPIVPARLLERIERAMAAPGVTRPQPASWEIE